MHSSAAAAHAAVAECEDLDEHDGGLLWHVEHATKEVLHIRDVLQDTLVVDSQLDDDQVGLLWNVKGEAEREVVGASGGLCTVVDVEIDTGIEVDKPFFQTLDPLFALVNTVPLGN